MQAWGKIYKKCSKLASLAHISGELRKKKKQTREVLLKMIGESKITELFRIFGLIILLEEMTCFESWDGMCVCMHVCT